MFQHSWAFPTARKYYLLVVAVTIFFVQSVLAQTRTGISTKRVSGPGGLDWAYVVTGSSPADTPDDLPATYTWRGQSYDFFHPNDSADGDSNPLVIYISPSNRSKGWHFWEAICRRHGVMYAGTQKAGNSIRFDRRIRIVLDVLDDIRSQYQVDPDRTYLVGFSGGAMVAQRIALRLPEFFGGVLCAGQMVSLPRDASLRHRTRDRLSFALVCGERDPIAPFVEFCDAHILQGFNYRCETEIVTRLGHRMPPVEVLEKALLWMEEGVSQRRQLAAEYPMSSISQTLTREEWAAGLLAEAKARLNNPNDAYRGMAILENIASRWPDLPETIQAKSVLQEQKSNEKAPWHEQLEAETRLIARLRAESLQRLATAPVRGFVRDQQGAIALQAAARWEQLLAESTDEDERQAITRNIGKLRDDAKQTASSHGLRPLQATRFRLVGKLTVQEGIDRISAALEDLGYELVINEQTFPDYSQMLIESRYLQLPSATAEQALQVLLGIDQIKLSRRGKQLHVSPK